MPTLKYQGCSLFRQRIVASLLSCQPLKIENIRAKDDAPGLQDFEANFLSLIEKITDGCHIEINETGTTLRFKPGLLQGSSSGSSTGTGRVVTHNCGTSRSIGWFIEGILPLALFCKTPVDLVLTGITNDSTDLSVDILKSVTLPLLQNFGVWGASLVVKQRGCMPGGGGIVELKIPPVKTALKPLHVTEEGLVKRVRGVVFSAKISPNTATRVIESCRGVLNHVLPDVFINTDHYSGAMAGKSPGYSLSLVAETTTGVLLSIERTPRMGPSSSATGHSSGVEQGWVDGNNKGSSGTSSGGRGGPELPEDVGTEAAMMLLQEIYKGGVVDSMHQPLVLQLMVLTPEDVSKVRFGALTAQSVQVLQLLREAFGVTFKIKQETHEPPSALQQLANKRSAQGNAGEGERSGKRAKHSSSYSDSDNDSSDSDEGSAGSAGSEGEDSDNEDADDYNQDDEGEGSNSDGSSQDKANKDEEEGSGESDEHSEGDSSDEGSIDAGNVGKGKGSKKAVAAAEVPLPTRTTVLLSCYGVGYTNVYRKVT